MALQEMKAAQKVLVTMDPRKDQQVKDSFFPATCFAFVSVGHALLEFAIKLLNHTSSVAQDRLCLLY